MSDTKTCVLRWIEQAARAPSADNLQPWELAFQIQDDKIVVTLSLNHNTLQNPSVIDANYVCSFIALGAFAQNLETLAAADGFVLNGIRNELSPNRRVKEDREPYGDESQKILYELSFVSSAKAPVPLVKWISKRRTSRRPFKAQPLTQSHQVELQELNKGLRSAKVRYLTVENCYDAIKIISKVDELRYVHQKFFFDFLDTLRFGDDAERTKDGLAGSTLGVPVAMRLVLAVLKKYRFLWIFNFLGSQYFSAWYACTRLLRRSAGLVTVQGDADSAMNWFDLGFDLQKLWLELTSREISVQPVGTTLILYRAYLEESHQLPESQFIFSTQQILTLKTLRQRLQDRLGIDITRPHIVLRVGYAEHAKEDPTSLRKEVRVTEKPAI